MERYATPNPGFTEMPDIESWFETNTYNSASYAKKLGKLVDRKREEKIKISLGIPTLNEGKTIGKVITIIRKKLVEQFPLLDEIMVIDSGSEDDTKSKAQEAGARFCLAEKHLKDEGVFYGKGENLWTSLYVLKGDLIVWIDADISNIHPRFVYGLIGPFFDNPHLGFVKGFYHRPLVLWSERGIKVSIPEGGGRVTELTFRPLINKLFPELAGFIQPLSGEYAGRREILEQVPFFTGYGVESGLLIDIMRRFGLEKMGQSDLKKRIHRNQSVRALSKMAFGVMNVILKRAQEIGRMDISGCFAFRNSYQRFLRDGSKYSLDTTTITENEKRPIIEIPEYRKRHKRKQ